MRAGQAPAGVTPAHNQPSRRTRLSRALGSAVGTLRSGLVGMTANATSPRTGQPQQPAAGATPRARWESMFSLFYFLRVQCPVCDRIHGLSLYRDQMHQLTDAAGDEALSARLARLEADRALVRCPICVVRYGGETPDHQ